MITPLPQLLSQYHFTVRGVIHIGAHHGQEYSMYKDAGIKNIIMIEADPNTFEIMKQNVGPECILFSTALGNKEGNTSFYVEESIKGQASSCLKPSNLGLKQFRDITWNREINVSITKLDLLPFNKTNFNFISVSPENPSVFRPWDEWRPTNIISCFLFLNHIL